MARELCRFTHLPPVREPRAARFDRVMYSPFIQDQAYSTGACITSAIPTTLLAMITQNVDTTALVVLNVVLFFIAQGFVFLRWYLDRKRKDRGD